jgi:adenylate cyclase
MKRCPECRRDYYDDTLLYCLDDGNELLEGPASDSFGTDGPQTAILPNAFSQMISEETNTAVFRANDDRSIAVLPFVNMSADVDNEYFCDGLAEDLLTALSKIGGIKVAARTSSFSFKGKSVEVGEIGERLSVKTVLEGSVRRSGDKLRITAQLINAADGYHLWSERYDRQMDDVFAIQDEITGAIVHNLKVELLGLPERDPVNLDAYNETLKGRHWLSKRTAEDLQKGVTCFERALEFDPGYAPAFAGLADSYNLLGAGDYAVLQPSEAFPKAKDAAIKAIEIDPSLASAHAALGWAAMCYDWDLNTSEQHFLRSISLNPNYSTAHHWYGMLLAQRGDFDKAVAEIKTARDLDPLSPIVNADVAWVYYFARRFDDAVHQCRKMVEVEPDFSVIHWNLGQSLREKGMLNEAIAAFRRSDELSGGNEVFRATLAHALGLAGRRSEALAILDEFLARLASQFVASHAMVMIYLGLGETDKAVEWFERAYEERSDFVIEAVKNPIMDPIREEARVQELLRTIGSPG